MVHLSDQYSNFFVIYTGDRRDIQLVSMRKKIAKHNELFSHKTCGSIDEKQITGKIESAIDRYYDTTCKIFNTVYYQFTI